MVLAVIFTSRGIGSVMYIDCVVIEMYGNMALLHGRVYPKQGRSNPLGLNVFVLLTSRLQYSIHLLFRNFKLCKGHSIERLMAIFDSLVFKCVVLSVLCQGLVGNRVDSIGSAQL